MGKSIGTAIQKIASPQETTASTFRADIPIALSATALAFRSSSNRAQAFANISSLVSGIATRFVSRSPCPRGCACHAEAWNGTSILVVYGGETPTRSLAEIEAMGAVANVRIERLARGKLAVHEEFPDAVAALVAPFIAG